MQGHFNLPPFGIIEKTQLKIKGNRVFTTTTSGVMVKNQPVIHLNVGMLMNEIGHPQSRTENRHQ